MQITINSTGPQSLSQKWLYLCNYVYFFKCSTFLNDNPICPGYTNQRGELMHDMPYHCTESVFLSNPLNRRVCRLQNVGYAIDLLGDLNDIKFSL